MVQSCKNLGTKVKRMGDASESEMYTTLQHTKKSSYSSYFGIYLAGY